MTRVLASICLIALLFGCRKSPANAGGTPPTNALAVSPMETIARIHWLGKNRIAADTNAATFLKIWNLPESAKLEAQTLDKLSIAPWRFLRGETNHSTTNLLRPLLDDLANEESYVEVRRAANSTNAADEMVLAIRLDTPRAALWETNLAAALESLTGIRPVTQPSGTNSPARWSLTKHHAPNLIEFARVGDWTIVGAAQDHNPLLGEITARIEHDHAPADPLATNVWLEVRVDPAPVLSSLGNRPLNLPSNLPAVSLSLIGEDRNVRTRAQLDFPTQPPIVLDTWNIPTNLIASKLTSFTAARGFKDWLRSSKFWSDLHLGEPPNQMCGWAVQGFPALTYFAAPLPDASNTVAKITDLVLAKSNTWFGSNGFIGFQRSKTFNGLEWRGLPYMSPFLESAALNNNSFIVAGFLGQERMEGGPPPSLLPQLNETNLVAYDWELTGMRIDQWLYMGQFARVVLRQAQLPPGAASLAWLKAAAHQLEFSATEVTQTGPSQLSINRRSTIGFTAPELNLLADWLESPDFPRGLYSTAGEPKFASPSHAP